MLSALGSIFAKSKSKVAACRNIPTGFAQQVIQQHKALQKIAQIQNSAIVSRAYAKLKDPQAYYDVPDRSRLPFQPPGQVRDEFEVPEDYHRIFNRPDLMRVPKKKIRGPKPAFKDLILVKHTRNLGFAGEQFTIRRNKAALLLRKKRAVLATPENIEKYGIGSKHPEYVTQLAFQREKYNLRWPLQRGILQFYRRAPGPEGELEYPITPQDICNKAWQVLKVPIRPEQIIMPNNQKKISKVGYYKCWVDIEQPPHVKLRVYVFHTKKGIL
eukprot:GEZU01009107.1.p1 GENE.GEZU01009107.1~~GEZU01009107.1.p1  ORF type:complete len:282 (-),score=50.02 GEZU01009107.1:222-1034(-)